MRDCPYELKELSPWAIEYVETVDSTNLLAKRRAINGAPHGTLILAGEQTAGRGRRGRGWLSPPGQNIYMTLIVRPEALPAERAAELVYVDSVALAQAIADVSGMPILIKWPNDLVANGKKLVGTLLEMRADNKLTEWAVIGMGINVLGTALPPELPHATTLEIESGRAVDRTALVRRFLQRFAEQYKNWAQGGLNAVMPAYRALSATLGRAVRAEAPDQTYEGIAAGIAPDGALLLDLEDGQQIALHAGDVSVRGMMGYV